jgi:AAA15 family ATPase/GTPase
MLKSLKIKNFRCFEEFDLPQLGRVNLLVGKNNSGKTSILEALHVLNSPNDMDSFAHIMEYRGEHFWDEKNDMQSFKISHLFLGHQINNESSFEILGIDKDNKESNLSVAFTSGLFQELIKKISNNKKIEITNLDRDNFLDMHYFLKWEKSNDCIFLVYFPKDVKLEMFPKVLKNSRLVYLNSSSMNTTIEQFNKIVLTSQEEILYESLRIIEPGIERIAPISDQGYRGVGNGGFVVLINKQRVPIGSMGYGIWRMLEITLAMVNIPGGTLLIDEIDTGLHFSVMIDLWKLICKTAEKLDIQVFATTHNSDCWKSLAEVANSDDIASDDITIHRIERGKKASIVFNEQEMAIAAERDIEVR